MKDDKTLGPSAYEEAVVCGYRGSFEEWQRALGITNELHIRHHIPS